MTAPEAHAQDRPLRVLIVDDEPLARRRLRRMLLAERDVEVIREAATGEDAHVRIERDTPDVVMLDVQMPAGDGFDVADRIGTESLPVIVFVTAYDEYALRAFEAAAIDYLLKPVRKARLHEALERARRQVALVEHVGGATMGDPAHAPVTRILLDHGQHLDVAQVSEIEWIEAANNHVIVHIRRERAS
jgi:two-component system, LytTR family, response regulator